MAESPDDEPQTVLMSSALASAVDELGKKLQSSGEITCEDRDENYRSRVIQYLVNSMKTGFESKNILEEKKSTATSLNLQTEVGHSNGAVNLPTDVEVELEDSIVEVPYGEGNGDVRQIMSKVEVNSSSEFKEIAQVGDDVYHVIWNTTDLQALQNVSYEEVCNSENELPNTAEELNFISQNDGSVSHGIKFEFITNAVNSNSDIIGDHITEATANDNVRLCFTTVESNMPNNLESNIVPDVPQVNSNETVCEQIMLNTKLNNTKSNIVQQIDNIDLEVKHVDSPVNVVQQGNREANDIVAQFFTAVVKNESVKNINENINIAQQPIMDTDSDSDNIEHDNDFETKESDELNLSKVKIQLPKSEAPIYTDNTETKDEIKLFPAISDEHLREAAKIGFKAEAIHQCFECGKCFTRKHSMSVHMKIHSDPFKCSYCEKVFSQRGHLVEHERKHTGEKPYACADCGRCFATSAAHTFHKRLHTGERPFSCDVCGKTFVQSSGLKLHQEIHTRDGEPKLKTHSCPNCPKQFVTKTMLKMHIRLKCDTIKEHLCDICGKVYGTKHNLEIHRKCHIKELKAGDEQIPCDTCGKAFHSKRALVLHAKCHSTAPKERKPKIVTLNCMCDECGKGFNTNKKLQAHLDRHEEDRKLGPLARLTRRKVRPPVSEENVLFQCLVCSKEFKSRGHLKAHAMIHSGEKPNVCKFCNKAFIQKSSLVRHIKVHTGEKNHLCLECGKSFREPDHLRYHMNAHAGIRPYPCETCGKLFRSKSALNSHAFVHLPEKTFQCRICGKKLQHRQSLKDHLKLHTGAKKIYNIQHDCETCGALFSWRQSYLKHKKKCHNNSTGTVFTKPPQGWARL